MSIPSNRIRTTILRASLTVWFLLALSPLLLARDVFVNNVDGDDSRLGTSPTMSGTSDGPCRTIARALKLVGSGDRIILAKTDEPYRESITLQARPHSGIPAQPFQILGNGATLDGTKKVPPDDWDHVMGDVFRIQPPRTSYQMLYLGPKPAKRRPTMRGEGLPSLEPLEWCIYDRYLYFRCEAGVLPRQYDLSYAHLPVGITLYEARHIVISDLIVQGFQLDGLNAHDNVFDATLVGITARGNGRSGISVGGACRVKIVECLVGDNGTAQVRTEGYCKTEIVDCALLENTAPGLVREGGQVVVRAAP